MDVEEFQEIIEDHQNWGGPVSTYVLYYKLAHEAHEITRTFDSEWDALAHFSSIEGEIEDVSLIQETFVTII